MLYECPNSTHHKAEVTKLLDRDITRKMTIHEIV